MLYVVHILTLYWPAFSRQKGRSTINNKTTYFNRRKRPSRRRKADLVASVDLEPRAKKSPMTTTTSRTKMTSAKNEDPQKVSHYFIVFYFWWHKFKLILYNYIICRLNKVVKSKGKTRRSNLFNSVTIFFI